MNTTTHINKLNTTSKEPFSLAPESKKALNQMQKRLLKNITTTPDGFDPINNKMHKHIVDIINMDPDELNAMIYEMEINKI